jgi:SAM-dependent methyltransferase
MNIATEMTDLVRAHTSPSAGMVFYNSLESVRSDADLLGYVSVIERAWCEMKLDGVLCLDSRPVLYLKEHGRPFSFRERILLQRLFWNQGVANVLVLADPTSVYIYSGLAKPLGDHADEKARENALVEILVQADYVQRIQSLYHDLATGHYYETHRKHFDPDQSVDLWLLDNLRALRNTLIEGDERLDTKEAHAFIGRVLFLCYLLDRGIVSVGKPDRGRTGTMLLAGLLEGRSHDSQIKFLYEFFDDLKDRFNGNMFDQDLDVERGFIRPSHLDNLIRFLGGHNVESGQRSLGFWPYDFKMIPVETISAIYQDFLATEDRAKQRERGAFYTPRFLAEMVVDIAIRDEPDAYDWSFLDAACGSGIFLVILFNRLANHWIHTQAGRPHYATKAKALQEILARQISGVDVEETACRIACFSLYLAYLDFFDPPDIQKYMEKTGQPLPKLLDYGDKLDRPGADIPVIHKADFLAEETLFGKTFDCIIGNPPWEGRQSKQLAQKFMQEAPRFLKSGGTGCLLLPTKILQNQTDAFQAEWLVQVTLERVLQLADYRHLLFQNAKTPAFIARFKKTPSQLGRHMVEFAAPKFNRDGLRQGIVTVNPSARTWIPLADILAATQSKTAPVVWKRRLWGTPRDQKLLDLLQSLPPLSNFAGTPREGKRWIKGQGFQPYDPKKAESDPNYPEPKPNPWSLDTHFVRTDQHLEMIIFQQDCITLWERLEEIKASKEHLRRAPSRELFKAPMVLVSHGFSKVAYCDFDVIFQSTLQSIAGPRQDTDLLMFLAAYLRSNLARYFLFHTSANWGSERAKVHLVELLRVPFPLPENEVVSPDAGLIVKQVAQKIGKLRGKSQDTLSQLKANAKRQSLFDKDETDISRQWHLERKRLTDKLQKEIEPLIYRYFGLTEQEITLVEDTICVCVRSSTPTTWRSAKTVTLDPVEKTTVEPYSTQGLAAYADTLANTLNKWAQTEGSSHRVCVEGGTDDQTGLAMVTIRLARAEATYQQKSLSRDLIKILKEFHSHASKRHGTLLYERDILLFQGQQIHIVRPNLLLNWTRTAALNDAARIYGKIALAKEES